MVFPVDNILPLIPQKPPFVFVDKLLHADNEMVRSEFTVLKDTLFIDKGIFQEAGLMENMAQTAALRAGYRALAENKSVHAGYIGSVTGFEVFGLPQVNDQLTTEVYITGQVFNVTILTAKVWHQTTLLAGCEMKVFTGDKEG